MADRADVAALVPLPQAAGLAALGQAANTAATATVFALYQERRPATTLVRQQRDLALFGQFLATHGAVVGDLFRDPLAWRGMSWGLVAGYHRWLQHAGYALTTANVRLATVKRYSHLAFQAGMIEADEHARIGQVRGVAYGDMPTVDRRRVAAGVTTRYERPGKKKAQPHFLNNTQLTQLHRFADTPQGRRDTLLVLLLAELGLRVSEVANLPPDALDLDRATLRFYRTKVKKWQTHELRLDLLYAARRYLTIDGPGTVFLLRASKKTGALLPPGARAHLSARAIQKRVQHFGRLALAIENLSPHDLRHTWTERARQGGTDLYWLAEAGGWSNLQTVMKYLDAAKIANEGVRLKR